MGWSLRVDDAGAGVLDRLDPEPTPPPFTPPPFTTIAWWMCHLIGDVLGSRVHRHFGDQRFDRAHFEWPTGAAAALDLLDAAHGAWTRGVAVLDTGQLQRRALSTDVGYHGPSMAPV
jgi:hypothetical protein